MIIKFFSFSKKYFFPILVLSLVFVWLAPNWIDRPLFDDSGSRALRSDFPLGYILTDFFTGGYYESWLYEFKSQGLDIGYWHNRGIWYLVFLSIAIVEVQLMFTMAFFAFFLVFFSA